jgi:hypothetical protein
MNSVSVQVLREGPLFAIGQAMEIIAEASRNSMVLHSVYEGIFDEDPAFSQRCAYVIEHLTRKHHQLDALQYQRLKEMEFFSTRWWLATLLPLILSRAPWDYDGARQFAMQLCEHFDSLQSPVNVLTACLRSLYNLAVRFPELQELVHPRLYAGITSGSTALRIRSYMLLGIEAEMDTDR